MKKLFYDIFLPARFQEPVWTDWSSWSPCDGGLSWRTRSCEAGECRGDTIEKKDCPSKSMKLKICLKRVSLLWKDVHFKKKTHTVIFHDSLTTTSTQEHFFKIFWKILIVPVVTI